MHSKNLSSKKHKRAERLEVSHENFYESIKDLINDPHVIAMKDIPQHTKEVSRYEHSLYVAYIAHKICLKFNLDAKTAARGGLLHDFEMHDKVRKSTGAVKMFFLHPKVAVKHSSKLYDLNEIEKDIIKKHMWPMTPLLIPKYKESFVVNLADKYCALFELLGRHKNSKVKNIAVIA